MLIDYGCSPKDHSGGTMFEPPVNCASGSNTAADLHGDLNLFNDFADHLSIMPAALEDTVNIDHVEPFRTVGFKLLSGIKRRNVIDRGIVFQSSSEIYGLAVFYFNIWINNHSLVPRMNASGFGNLCR